MPRPQHSPMLGQRASSHTVCRPPSRTIPSNSRKRVFGGRAHPHPLRALPGGLGERHRYTVTGSRSNSISKTSEKARSTAGRTSSTVIEVPVSAAIDVNGARRARRRRTAVHGEVEFDVEREPVGGHPARSAPRSKRSCARRPRRRCRPPGPLDDRRGRTAASVATTACSRIARSEEVRAVRVRSTIG